MAYDDLRAFIRALEQARELKRITAEVDPILEISEIADRVSKSGGPALLFENVRGKFYMIAGDETGRRGNTPGYEGEAERMDGWIHIIEWDEWGEPHEVARYEVPEVGTHNLWVEDDILYIAYYQGGLRVVDLSGELLGDLYRQGREIGYFLA